MKSKPTMRDVARRAGVSVMAVSYALRGHPNASKETSERIRKIAAEMGYQVHPLVSVLIREIRAGRKVMSPPLIGYVSSYARRSYWMPHIVQGAYYAGAKARCEELGFGFTLYELPEYGMSGERLSKVMKYANVCGVVIGPVPVVGMEIDLDWDAFSSVAFAYSLGRPAIHRVSLNHLQSMQLVLRRLREMGYSRIATGATQRDSRRAGGAFVAAFDAYQREIPGSHRIPLLTSVPRTPGIMKKWLEKHRPDVFIQHFGCNVRDLILNAGWRIPEDIAYATLSWNPEFPEQAGLHQHSFHIGRTAVDVLVQQIHENRRGIPEIPSFTMLDGSWMDGASVPWKKVV